ncbi:TccC4 [Serratia sp. FS14]|nr:TccC4 [Serratia sp. FS14]AIA46974.1 TccC4 [Serratia sp. FS14]
MPVANTMADATLHHQTPTVTLTGSNGQVVRSLDFLRRPGDTGPARPLVRRLCLDPCSRTFRTYGARPLAQGAPDALTLSGLSAQPLLSHTADGGTSHTLSDISGRPAWARSAEGTVTTWQYESPDLPGRLLSVTEQAADTAQPRVCQVYISGGARRSPPKSGRRARANMG